MNFVDFHTHQVHFGVTELVSAQERPEGAERWSLEIHPWYSKELPEDFEEKAAAADALGETGFDKVRGILPYPAEQCKLFSAVLKVAEKLHKPVVIHAVGSFELLFQTVRPYIGKVPMLFHGFSRRSPELLGQLVRQGFRVSLSPQLLDDSQIRAYCQVHPEHIGLESDDSNIPIEELYKRFAVPDFAEHAERNWKEFWSK